MTIYTDEVIKNKEHISRNINKIGQPMKFSSSDGSLPFSPYKELVEEEKFRIASNTAPMIWTADVDMSFNFFNKAWIDFTGADAEEQKNSKWMNRIHPDDLNKFKNIYVTSFNARKHFSLQFRLKKHNGDYCTFIVNGEPKYSSDEKFEGYIGNCTEIHEPKVNPLSFEQQFAERSKAFNSTISKLEQSNLELTQFAYVATHDLQEPLRKIRIFTDRLLLKTATKLNNDEVSYLNKIKSSTGRMSDLIKDVLEYSLLSRSNEPYPLTDLNGILQNVLTDFELLITQKKATISADQLPTIEAVPLQMNQLFNNLISNSLKFTSQNIPPVITIKQLPLTAQEKKIFNLNTDMTYIKVQFSDNGIGFDKEYSEQIFEIFQRLNGNEKYPGTGIGLALCKKIIMNHKGRVSAESSPGEGATFNIFLPLKQHKNSELS
jgi:two-component system, chemotaxis family, CheB/CheR fusion protein